MNKAVSSLLLKSNRVLGAQLVDCGLITLQQLEAANAVLLDRLVEGKLEETSLLKVLIFEQGVLDERNLLNYQIEHRGISGMTLAHYEADLNTQSSFDPEECLATWTLPIDEVSGVWFLASAYYLSPFVRRYWADKLNAEAIWYATPMLELESAIDSIAAARNDLARRVAVS